MDPPRSPCCRPRFGGSRSPGRRMQDRLEPVFESSYRGGRRENVDDGAPGSGDAGSPTIESELPEGIVDHQVGRSVAVDDDCAVWQVVDAGGPKAPVPGPVKTAPATEPLGSQPPIYFRREKPYSWGR